MTMMSDVYQVLFSCIILVFYVARFVTHLVIRIGFTRFRHLAKRCFATAQFLLIGSLAPSLRQRSDRSPISE